VTASRMDCFPLGVAHFLPAMVTEKRGILVCTGGFRGQGFRGHITYLASVKAVRSPVTIGCEDRFGFGRCQAEERGVQEPRIQGV